jgi:hypothetical protein
MGDNSAQEVDMDEPCGPCKPPDPDRTGRRDLLKKVAAGAAGAWVAPALISEVAAAQGSPAGPSITPETVDVLRCDNVTTDPGTIGTGGGGDPLIPYPAGSMTGDLILVSASANEDNAVTFNVTTNAGTPVAFTQLYNIVNTGGIVTSLWYLPLPATNAGTGVLVTFSALDTPAPVTVALLRVAGASTLAPTFTQNQSTVAKTSGSAPALAVGAGSLAINITATPLGAAPFTPQVGWINNGNASLNGGGSGCGNNRPDLAFISRPNGTDSAGVSWATARAWTSVTFEALP